MALIGTLRSQMGIWVVVFVFVAIASFILSDLLGSKSFLFQNDSVGKIAGNKISQKEYQNALDEQEMNYSLQFNRAPGEREKSLLQNQAWEMLIVRNAIESQYKKLGIEVSADELWDMIQGKNVDEGLKSTPDFQDATGQFDRNKMVQFIQMIRNEDPRTSERRFRWDLYQKNIQNARQRLKYENLLIKTAYVTTAEAEREYHVQSDVAELKYLYVPYYAIGDSSAIVTDEDLESYYNENKAKYKTEPLRDISYVSFSKTPSAADSADLKQRLDQIAADFKTTSNDSLFAAGSTETPENAYMVYNPSNMPSYLSADSVKVGSILGPFVEGQFYKVVKISSVVPVAQARHILVKWTADTPVAKKEAEDRALSILGELKGGADFATKAREVSEDPGSAQSGGDLGWFSQKDMVKPFADAVFGATKAGLVNQPIESNFGYHIIDVTTAKQNKGYVVVTVQYEIAPRDAAINDALHNAETFQAGLSGVEEFRNKAKQAGYNVMDAKGLTGIERNIGTLGQAREIVRWAFNEGKVGKVSDVVDVNDQFVVAVVTATQDKGYRSLNSVKEEITPLVRNKVKGRMIIDRLKKSQGALEDMAKAFGNDANVFSNGDLKLSTNSVPNIGFDPVVVGISFSLEKGKRSNPYAGESGVTIAEMQNKTVAPGVADYSVYKTQLEQSARSRSYGIAEAIKEQSEISDERYRFY